MTSRRAPVFWTVWHTVWRTFGTCSRSSGHVDHPCVTCSRDSGHVDHHFDPTLKITTRNTSVVPCWSCSCGGPGDQPGGTSNQPAVGRAPAGVRATSPVVHHTRRAFDRGGAIKVYNSLFPVIWTNLYQQGKFVGHPAVAAFCKEMGK